MSSIVDRAARGQTPDREVVHKTLFELGIAFDPQKIDDKGGSCLLEGTYYFDRETQAASLSLDATVVCVVPEGNLRMLQLFAPGYASELFPPTRGDWLSELGKLQYHMKRGRYASSED